MRQLAGTLRSRSLAFGFLIAQVVFGMMVTTHAVGFTELFNKQQRIDGADMDGAFCITSEDDDVALAPRDLAAMRRLPGVRSAAWFSNSPIRPRRVGGLVAAGRREDVTWEMHGTSEAARSLGFEVVRGRELSVADEGVQADRPVLVTAALAKSLFGPGDPLGQTFESRDYGAKFRVVGILRRGSVVPPIQVHAENMFVQAASPVATRHAEFVVNVAPAERAGFPAALEAALRQSAPERFLRVETLREGIKRIYQARIGAMIVFGSIVVLVVGVVLLGSLGMSTYLVAERLREIGVRRAMGARRRDIAGYFLFESFAVTLIGTLTGSVASLLMNKLLVQRVLPFVVLDFRHLILGIILFQVTGLVAASVPALRASRVPPSVASKTV